MTCLAWLIFALGALVGAALVALVERNLRRRLLMSWFLWYVRRSHVHVVLIKPRGIAWDSLAIAATLYIGLVLTLVAAIYVAFAWFVFPIVVE